MKANKIKKAIALTALAAIMTATAGCGTNRDSGSGSKNGKDKYPGKKQISIVVPYAAGGASDTTARIFAAQLEKAVGTTVTVTNVEGASGAIGLQQVANSKADGHTIAYMPVESTMIKALGYSNISTDDFKFICRAMTIPAAVTVRADSKWKTFEEFIGYAKKHPREIKVGNSGTGSIWHIAAASIEKECGVKFTHVPFDGAAPAVAALLGNNIQAVTVSPSEVQANVESGDFRVLAVLGDKRSDVVPDVKTAKELGVDITIQGWGGFAVPKDTPRDVIDILNRAAKKAVNSEEMKKVLDTKGFTPAYLSGADMDNEAAKLLKEYSKLIPELGIAK